MILPESPPAGKAGSCPSLLGAALQYHDQGLCIIPVKGKVAVGKWKAHQTNRPTISQLRQWFRQPDVTGMAVILGAVSGMLANRDFDVPGAYERWADGHHSLAKELPTARTSRGHHVYFRTEAETYATLPDGELRADSRHYCLLPPSLHPDGPRYTWTVPLEPRHLPVLDPHEEGFLSSTAELLCKQRTQKHKQ